MFEPYMHFGGGLMWPIWVCSVLLGAVLIERLWTLGWHKLLRGRPLSPRQARWHRRVLPFFVDVPTSLGLLGTVVGIVATFDVNGGRIDGDSLAAGLGTATFTTIAGLSVAITASVSGYLLNWILAEDFEREPESPAHGTQAA